MIQAKNTKKGKKGKSAQGEAAKVGHQSAGASGTGGGLESSQISELIAEGVRKAMQQEETAVRRGRWNSRPNMWCDFCKSHTHVTDECYIKNRIDQYNEKERQEKEKGKEKEKAGPSEKGERVAKVSQIEGDGVDVQLLYTPAEIDGHAFRRCMVDTGSEVNVLPLKEAVRFGIPYDPCAITQIIGFNGSPSPVEGLASCSLSVAPCEGSVVGKFLVTSGVSGGPILGFPALEALGLGVDCSTRELSHKTSGKVVRCAAAAKPRKN